MRPHCPFPPVGSDLAKPSLQNRQRQKEKILQAEGRFRPGEWLAISYTGFRICGEVTLPQLSPSFSRNFDRTTFLTKGYRLPQLHPPIPPLQVTRVLSSWRKSERCFCDII